VREKREVHSVDGGTKSMQARVAQRPSRWRATRGTHSPGGDEVVVNGIFEQGSDWGSEVYFATGKGAVHALVPFGEYGLVGLNGVIQSGPARVPLDTAERPVDAVHPVETTVEPRAEFLLEGGCLPPLLISIRCLTLVGPGA
jgi:hypothetical protein